jgi:hypothetical protein
LGFTWFPLKPLKRTKEGRGFDESHRVQLAARAIIQEPFSSGLNFNQAASLPVVEVSLSFAGDCPLCHVQQTR